MLFLLIFLLVSASGQILGQHQIRTVRVTTILQTPYMMDTKRGSGNDRYEGIMKDIINDIARRANFNYTITPAKDSKYGERRNREGHTFWTGMIGDLTNNEADLAVAPLTITEARQEAADFSLPFFTGQLSVLMKKPTKGYLNYKAFGDFGHLLRPFTLESWIMIAVGVFLVGALAIVIACCRTETKNCATPLTVLFVGSLFCFGVGLAAYSAHLHTTPEEALQYSTIQELLDADVELHAFKGGMSARTIGLSRRKQNEEIRKKLKTDLNTTEEGIRIVQNSKGKTAFILNADMAAFLASRNCDLYVVRETLDTPPVHYALAIAEESPWLQEPVDKSLAQMLEQEIVQAHYDYWFDRGRLCPKPKRALRGRCPSTYPIRVANLVPLAIILGIFLIATIIFAIIQKCRREPEEQLSGSMVVIETQDQEQKQREQQEQQQEEQQQNQTENA